jgi:hypothetical protein
MSYFNSSTTKPTVIDTPLNGERPYTYNLRLLLVEKDSGELVEDKDILSRIKSLFCCGDSRINIAGTTMEIPWERVSLTALESCAMGDLFSCPVYTDSYIYQHTRQHLDYVMRTLQIEKYVVRFLLMKMISN